MAATRDGILEAVKAAEAEYYANPADGRFMPDVIADLILSRETELRRQIADELNAIRNRETDLYDYAKDVSAYIAKLRGNK